MFTLEEFVRNERVPFDNQGNPQLGSYVTNDRIGDTAHFDPGLQRPYRLNNDDGRVWVDVCVANELVRDKETGFPVTNALGQHKYQSVYEPQLVRDRMRRDLPVFHLTTNATVLRKDEWILLDQTVVGAIRRRLKLWQIMRASATYGGFDGMATPVLEFEKLTDAGQALVDMDGLGEGNNAAPTFGLDGMPLPITHSDFWLSQRYLATSRRRGMGADRTRMEMAGRRCGEAVEQTSIGTLTGVAYGKDASTYDSGTSKVYGLTNHPDRITDTGITGPTGSNGATILTEWLSMRNDLYVQNMFGPFDVFVSTSYDEYLDNLFSTTEPSAGTLRDVLMRIDTVRSIQRLDYLTTSGTLLWTMLGASGDNLIQAVNGMEFTTVQWETKGGMQLNFKVMGIQVPWVRSANINTATTGPASTSAAKAPILHATT